MEKIYRVQMNSSGMPNFSTAVEIDTDISEYSDKLWKNAYERGKADRPQGEWTCRDLYWHTAICSNCNKVTMFEEWDGEVMEYNYCPNCGARMKGADDE